MRSKILAFLVFVMLVLCIAVNPAFATGGRSLQLTAASSQYASIASGSQTGLGITGDLTIESWVKPASQPGQVPPGRCIIDRAGGDHGYEIIYEYDSGTYYLLLVIGIGSGPYSFYLTDSSPILPTNTWTHVAFVFTAGSRVELFLNGVSALSSTSSIPASISTVSTNLYLGTNVGVVHNWDGLLDDIRIWSTARTAQEISDNMSKELVGDESGLQAYWKFNGVYTDATSNHNDLSATNSPVFSNDSIFDRFSSRKATDQSVTSNTALQNDDDLFVSLNTGSGTYSVEGAIFATSSSASPDIKIAFTVPSGATMGISYLSSEGGGELLVSSGTSSVTIPISASGVTVIHIHGTVALSTSTGIVQLQWAQASSNGTATTVKTSSYLVASKF